jgi:hypothetical protein
VLGPFGPVGVFEFVLSGADPAFGKIIIPNPNPDLPPLPPLPGLEGTTGPRLTDLCNSL